MKQMMRDGGEHKVNLLSTGNHTDTYVHLSQGTAVSCQILWWAVVSHRVQPQAQQYKQLCSLSYMSFK